MSGTTTLPTPPTQSSNRGTVVTSIVTQVTFLVALVAAAYLYWITKDPVVLALLGAMLGSTQTNATSVVNYWIGSSSGSSKKTDLMAANPPPPPVVPGTTTVTTTTPVPTPGPLTP